MQSHFPSRQHVRPSPSATTPNTMHYTPNSKHQTPILQHPPDAIPRAPYPTHYTQSAKHHPQTPYLAGPSASPPPRGRCWSPRTPSETARPARSASLRISPRQWQFDSRGARAGGRAGGQGERRWFLNRSNPRLP